MLIHNWPRSCDSAAITMMRRGCKVNSITFVTYWAQVYALRFRCIIDSFCATVSRFSLLIVGLLEMCTMESWISIPIFGIVIPMGETRHEFNAHIRFAVIVRFLGITVLIIRVDDNELTEDLLRFN